jgi:pectate lyase
MKFQVLTTSLLLSLGVASPLPATNQADTSPISGGNNDFASAAAGELIGYGAKTTGGAGGAEKSVSSCADLKSAVTGNSAKIVKISGMLKGCGIIDIGSNTSVL